jgi:hypothetical protein
MDTEQIALSQVEKQLRQRGFSTNRMPRNRPDGDIHATKGNKLVRLEVKGLEKRNGVWLKKRQIEAVDIIVIYVVEDDDVWVLSPKKAYSLLENYRSDFFMRHGRLPKQEGFNKSQFPEPTGWAPLDHLF